VYDIHLLYFMDILSRVGGPRTLVISQKLWPCDVQVADYRLIEIHSFSRSSSSFEGMLDVV
jgi:hypothetical protein